jgi:hypothetical protein
VNAINLSNSAYVRIKIRNKPIVAKMLIDSGNLVNDLISEEFARIMRVKYGTPTKRQVSKRQVSKRPVSKRPVSKRQVYKTSGLQNVRFQNVWFQNVQILNLIYL